MADHQPSEEDHREARRLAEEMRRSLPERFTLRSDTPPPGFQAYPDLHFVSDEKIPGLYSAEVDPDFIMGYGSSGNNQHLNAHGTTEHVPEHMLVGGELRREFIHDGRHYEMQGFFGLPPKQGRMRRAYSVCLAFFRHYRR